jgi:hypothetical protein
MLPGERKRPGGCSSGGNALSPLALILDREIALALHYPVEERPFRRPVPLATLAGGTFLSNLAGCCPCRWHGFAPSRCAAELEEVSEEGFPLPGTVQRWASWSRSQRLRSTPPA